MGKLTEAQRRDLIDLSQRRQPMPWTGPNKAMGNKLVKLGLAEYRAGYPHGFCITEAGRRAFQQAEGGAQ